MHPADLGVVEASGLIAHGELSATELIGACLARIRERDGTHSHEGDAASVNAWVRVYEEGALAAAARADEQLAERVRSPGRAALAVGHPDRPQGSLRGRRRTADRLELAAATRCRRPTATSGRGCAPRA